MTKVIDIVREILDLPKKVDDVHYHNHHFAFAMQIDMSILASLALLCLLLGVVT